MKITVFTHDGKYYANPEIAQKIQTFKILNKIDEIKYEFRNYQEALQNLIAIEKKIKELQELTYEKIIEQEIEIDNNTEIIK